MTIIEYHTNMENTVKQFTWRVILNCRCVGYVVSFSATGATQKAEAKFGRNVWVERLAVGGHS